jgi:hypothetical protein
VACLLSFFPGSVPNLILATRFCLVSILRTMADLGSVAVKYAWNFWRIFSAATGTNEVYCCVDQLLSQHIWISNCMWWDCRYLGHQLTWEWHTSHFWTCPLWWNWENASYSSFIWTTTCGDEDQRTGNCSLTHSQWRHMKCRSSCLGLGKLAHQNIVI